MIEAGGAKVCSLDKGSSPRGGANVGTPRTHPIAKAVQPVIRESLI